MAESGKDGTAKSSEPQSYGSQKDWVTGKVSGSVNDPKAPMDTGQSDFYESRIDSETSGPDQGGRVSEAQAAESVQNPGPATDVDVQPTGRVSSEDGGAKRGSFFRDRDYR